MFVTNQDMDEPTASDDETVIHEGKNNDSSEKEQKVTAVIAIIDTATEDQASGHEHSKRCRRSSKLLFTKKSEYSWTLVLMEIFGSTGKELPNVFPTLKGRWQSLTILQLGFSKQKARPSLQ